MKFVTMFLMCFGMAFIASAEQATAQGSYGDSGNYAAARRTPLRNIFANRRAARHARIAGRIHAQQARQQARSQAQGSHGSYGANVGYGSTGQTSYAAPASSGSYGQVGSVSYYAPPQQDCEDCATEQKQGPVTELDGADSRITADLDKIAELSKQIESNKKEMEALKQQAMQKRESMVREIDYLFKEERATPAVHYGKGLKQQTASIPSI